VEKEGLETARFFFNILINTGFIIGVLLFVTALEDCVQVWKRMLLLTIPAASFACLVYPDVVAYTIRDCLLMAAIIYFTTNIKKRQQNEPSSEP